MRGPAPNSLATLKACTLLATGLLFTAQAHAAEPTEAEKLFALKVKPLLTEKCFACHGQDPDKIKGDLDISTLESTLKGGDYFAEEVLIPGDAAKSFLYLTTTRTEPDYEMPPKEADKLTEEETWYIRDWINGGAPWLSEERVAEIYHDYAEGVVMETSGGLSEEWTNRKYEEEKVWAYQPLDPPQIKSTEVSPVDQLINAKMEAAEVEPAPLADRRTLIRRVSFDLLGLPPKPEEVEAFVEDPRPDDVAFGDLVERLLDSPHYGEQWARHWLDVVRYADSSGYANDYERPNTWRYRDYVIRSFNEDKPYDQFIREQLAGDEISREDPEMLVATGFLRMGAWEHTGMSVAKVTRQLWLDDVTDTVGQVFLAHALQCARCHDHKFDPIPTRDYYSMQAVFATTQFAEQETEWLPEENRKGMDEDRKYHMMRAKQNNEMLQNLNKKMAANEKAWFEERGLPFKSRSEALKAKAPQDQIPERKVGFGPEDFGQERIGRKWKNRFTWEMDRYKPVAFTVYNGKTQEPKNVYGPIRMPENPMGKGQLQKVSILGGGDVFSPTIPVKPGVLSAVPGGLEHEVPDSVSGRRSALADWIADEDNSLTARVMVNRVWQYHFGRGIAKNPNNFGGTGEHPTHPELLDWLAQTFIDEGWSVKNLHRIILNSEAYRRSSSHPEAKALKDKDPDNDLYAKFQPRRLAAEELRDAMLSISGELNPEMGGIPIRPDMNLEAALQPRMIMGTFAPSYVPNPKPEDRNRRTIYAHKTRGLRDPFLVTFNQPTPETSCELRDASNVTPQVFTLFNGEESYDRALAFAHELKQSGDKPEAIIQRAFRKVFGRAASDAEVKECLAHWDQMREVQSQRDPQPREFPTEVVRTANDENTGKVFSFTEELFIYEDYVPDLQPHEVDADTRALADLCLVLFNSNEFAYIY